MEWWQEFFDEDYVTVWSVAGSFENTAGMVDDLERLLGLSPGARVLDIACGFGRIAGPLAARGYDVTGLDFSAAQLRLAEERNPGPHYVQADMRNPPAGPFDAAINLFSSFGYFDDPEADQAALAAWAGALRPGGVLVMELMHRDLVANRHGQTNENPGSVTEEAETDWVTGVVTATVRYREIVKIFRFRLYTVTQLVQMLRDAGFATVKAMSSLAGGTVTPASRVTLRAVR
jgi:SAM-dependent methyltransferase